MGFHVVFVLFFKFNFEIWSEYPSLWLAYCCFRILPTVKIQRKSFLLIEIFGRVAFVSDISIQCGPSKCVNLWIIKLLFVISMNVWQCLSGTRKKHMFC